jgi:hypothetical protein
MMFQDARDRLVHFRGDFPAKPLDARRIAGLLDAPGCTRRQVIDAASVPVKDLVPLLGCPPPGQSPFALERGVRFEHLVTDNAMGQLLALARNHLGLPVEEVRQKDLSRPQIHTQYGKIDDVAEFRARLTQQYVAEMLDGDQRAINLLRHPMIPLRLGEMPTYLEPDVVTYASVGPLTPIEIKSFHCLDGIADPVKVEEAARQTAVYLIGIRGFIASLGQPADRIATRGLLVMTRDFTLDATAELLDLHPQVRRLERTLARFPHVGDLAAHTPTAVTLPALPGRDATPTELRAASAQAAEAISALPMRYGDGCAGCPLLRFCTREARLQDSVAQLGTEAANLCGDVATVTAALELAAGARDPSNSAERAVAAELRRAAVAVQLAGVLP